MPRQATRKNVITFVGGLNTEASPLSYPENTAKEIQNVDLYRDGSLRRRRGLEYETSYEMSSNSFTEEQISTYAITNHKWESVQGDDSLNFLVLQVGHYLYFHKLGSDSISGTYLGKIDLTPLRISDTYDHTSPISAAAGKGKLFIVSRGISPAYIQYDQDTGLFQGVKLTLKIRDLDGIPEDEDSPIVFGDEITPPAPLNPEDNYYDVLSPGEIPDFGAFIIYGL
jgi:hypothetical protein